MGEPRKYATPSGGVTAAEEQAPEKIRSLRLSRIRPVPETDTGGRV